MLYRITRENAVFPDQCNHEGRKIQGAAAQTVDEHQRLTRAANEAMDAIGTELHVVAIDTAANSWRARDSRASTLRDGPWAAGSRSTSPRNIPTASAA